MTGARGFGAAAVILTGLVVGATETGAGGGAELDVTIGDGVGIGDDEVVDAAAVDDVGCAT